MIPGSFSAFPVYTSVVYTPYPVASFTVICGDRTSCLTRLNVPCRSRVGGEIGGATHAVPRAETITASFPPSASCSIWRPEENGVAFRRNRALSLLPRHKTDFLFNIFRYERKYKKKKNPMMPRKCMFTGKCGCG